MLAEQRNVVALRAGLIKLGAGNDTTIGGTSTSDTIYGGEGADSFTITGAASKLTLTDTRGASRLIANGDVTDSTVTFGDLADTFNDVGGDEVITTSTVTLGGGNDSMNFHDLIGSTLQAGAGNDSIVMDGKWDGTGTTSRRLSRCW